MRQFGWIGELFEGEACGQAHFLGVGKHFPHIFADPVVDAFEDGEVDILFRVAGDVASADDFTPLL